jgi:tetratricopeptide (TPR) repeat protein
MKTKLRVGLQAAVLILAGIWVFWPVFHGAKLWDDNLDFPETRLAFNLSGLAKVWTGAIDLNYYPLKTTVQWIQWLLWGENTLGSHLTNVGLHVLSALLFWRLLGRFGVRWAWFGGLLFAVHPLAVESVAWMAEIKNALSLPLLLLAMSAFVSYDERKSAGKLVLSLVFFIAAMLCKSSVVMFPVVLLLYCWWKRGRIGLADVGASAAFFVFSLALGLVEMWYQNNRGSVALNLDVGGFFSRLAGAGLSVAFYLWKFVAPIGLMPVYPRWNVVPPSPAQFLPWLALGALVGWLWTKRASWGRDALFGLGCFGVNLLPVLGLIPMAYLRISWVADHFVYLPMLGLAGLAAAGAGALADRLIRVRRGLVAPLVGFAAVVLCALGVASHRYAAYFRDSEALWTYELQKNSQAWMGHYSLAYFYAVEPGRQADAIAHYEAALHLRPDFAEAHNNLAILLANEPGRKADTIAHFETALRINPNYADAHYNFAYFLASQPGRQADAIAHYEAALRIRPGYAKAENIFAFLLASLPGRQTEALAHYEAALRIEPNYAEAHNNMAILLAGLPGRKAEALAHYEAALRIEPNYAEAHNNLAILLANLPGRQADAIAHFEAALRLKPEYAEAHNNLANFLSSQPGRQADAIAQYEAALRIRPDYANAHYNLAVLLAKQPGRQADAAMHFKAALKINPDFAPAREALQRLQGDDR